MTDTVYVYTQCVEREITEPMFFPTLEQARAEMISDFKAMLETDRVADIETTYKKPIDQLDNIEEDDCGMNEVSAWANDCGLGHYHWDAKIHAMDVDSLFDTLVRIKSNRIWKTRKDEK